jgi:hypothetical protein
LSPSRKKSRNPPSEFIEDELLILKGRLEGEEDVIEKGEIDDDSERRRYIARADRVGNAIVDVKVPRWEGRASSRLIIPVFRNLFFGLKKAFLTEFLRIFFSCVFLRNFSQERGFGGGLTVIPVVFRFYRNFSQEFLWHCLGVETRDSISDMEIKHVN